MSKPKICNTLIRYGGILIWCAYGKSNYIRSRGCDVYTGRWWLIAIITQVKFAIKQTSQQKTLQFSLK